MSDDRYGLGDKRTIAQYLEFAGIDLKTKSCDPRCQSAGLRGGCAGHCLRCNRCVCFARAVGHMHECSARPNTLLGRLDNENDRIKPKSMV
jgi:hypothetical protein